MIMSGKKRGADSRPPRTQRTRAALISAFIELLLERGYDAVTVHAVAARAGVGRSTFYVHFPDKREILRQSLAAPSLQLARAFSEQLEPAALTPQLRHFHANRVRNRAFLLPPLRGLWVRFLADLIEQRLGPRISAARDRRLPRKLAALQLAESQLALIVHWLLEESSCDVETVAAALIASAGALRAAVWEPQAPI
jgi:AcrR family transcriptional regulator